MLKTLMDQIKALSLGEKYLCGICAGILINYHLAIVLALLVVGFYIYKIGKKLLPELLKD